MRRALYAVLTLLLLLGVVLAAWSWLDELALFEWHFRPGWLAVAIAAMAGLVLANALLWRQLLGSLGERLPVRRATAIWCVSALGRYVPTSVLMPVMRAAMAEREGVPKRITLASVVYEIALSFSAVLIIGAYFVIDIPQLGDQPERFAVLALPVLALGALRPSFFHPTANLVLKRLGRQRLPVSLSTRGVFLYTAGYSLSAVLGGLSLYALAQSVYPVGGEDMAIVIGAFSVGTALSVIAFVMPGGLVAREAGLTLALAPAIPAAPAVAIAVFVRILQLGVELVLAGITPMLARSRALTPPSTPNLRRKEEPVA